jgi:hypothetical protein
MQFTAVRQAVGRALVSRLHLMRVVTAPQKTAFVEIDDPVGCVGGWGAVAGEQVRGLHRKAGKEMTVYGGDFPDCCTIIDRPRRGVPFP